MAADHFCLRWNNYQSNMVSELDSLRSDEDLVDVTLSCEGHLLKAHKVILSACSSYFRNVFKDNPCKHPVVILKDVNYEDVEALLSFVYQGVVYISEKKLASFLQTAELLQIRGLTGAATTMKEATTFDDTLSNVNKAADKCGNNVTTVPPPPQLLTADLTNSWKQLGTLNARASTQSLNSQYHPKSVPVAPVKRKKCSINKSHAKENFEFSNTSNSRDSTDMDGDSSVQYEIVDGEIRPEDDYNSLDEITREESSREVTPSFYENMESDETEEEGGGDSCKRKSTGPVSSKPPSGSPLVKSEFGSSSATTASSNLFTVVQNYSSSQTSSEQNSPASGSHLAQCGNCPHCRKTYSNQSALKYHVRLVHGELTNQFSCYLCPMSFAHRDDYKAHMWEIHKVRNARLGKRPCPLCQKVISNKSNLLKHMRIRHSDEYNPAGCTACGKVFKNKYSLRAHVNIYHKETASSAAAAMAATTTATTTTTTTVNNNFAFSSYSPTAAAAASEFASHTRENGSGETATGANFSDQSSVSMFSPNSSFILSAVANEINSFPLAKESVLNQFGVSSSALT